MNVSIFKSYKEVWKPVPNYSSYQASNLGRIKTFNWKGSGKEAIMKPSEDKQGYLRTVLKRDTDGKLCTVKVHRIIAQTFISNPENKETVNHKNGIKTDNKSKNLEWATRKEQAIHAYKLGLCSSVVGENNPACKLTEVKVKEIREVYARRKVDGRGRALKGELSRRDIADTYGISESTLKPIISKRNWKHV